MVGFLQNSCISLIVLHHIKSLYFVFAILLLAFQRVNEIYVNTTVVRSVLAGTYGVGFTGVRRDSEAKNLLKHFIRGIYEIFIQNLV